MLLNPMTYAQFLPGDFALGRAAARHNRMTLAEVPAP